MTLTKISAVLLIALTLASCANTIRGVGRDVNASADAVEDSVN
ncbi:entericidin EcnA/B family protein [Hoeflea marina]|uniref:Entericidin EcnA/B family protein n=1 Tax=Hoeflea marina TaxID=274592 RepID=A0A317PHE1_9HYPH|nr:entericidin A/B family lipoprotein [Hoeflea marina]PWV99002.1 entericidin EcnA/B family protein [Hoeflea marina]